jgi:uridine kinase
MQTETRQVSIYGKTAEYPYGTSYARILEDFKDETKAPVILVTVNGRLRELHKQLKKDCTIVPVTVTDPIGYEACRRSACLILIKALYDVAGTEKLENVINHFSIGSGFYFTIHGEVELNETFLKRVKDRMQEIVDEQIPIQKRSVETAEAIEIFHRQRMYDKEKLFYYRRVSRVNLYGIEDFEDYFYGFMAHHTGYVRVFDLVQYGEGFVLQLPKRGEPDVLPPFCPREKIFTVQSESERWGEEIGISYVGGLNEKITREGIQKTILVQEAMQEARISAIAQQIKAAGNIKFVMIAGPSSSGKTTFSHRLSIQLMAHGMKPHPIALDNYFVERENTPLDENGEKDYERLEAIDVEQFNQDMLALLDGREVELPVFNFKTGHREYRGDYLKLGPEDILVIEGIHGLNDKLSYALPREYKFKIYISALTQLSIDEHNRIPTTDGRLVRRMVRDARVRGVTAKETIARWPSVRRGEELYIFPYQEEADVMFNSALVYELACLKVYAEPLLFGIGKEEPEYQEAKRLLKFFDYFVPVPSEAIPTNSILREFVGGGCFEL